MRKLLILLPLLSFPLIGQAADTLNVTVRGTLYAPTVCDVTGVATVDLGNIVTTKINGTEYSKALGVGISCTGRNPAQSVRVLVTGVGTTGNKLPLATSSVAKGFQLALKRGTAVQNFGAPIAMASDGTLNLNIVPENIATVPFTPGAFTAVMTVKVEVI